MDGGLRSLGIISEIIGYQEEVELRFIRYKNTVQTEQTRGFSIKLFSPGSFSDDIKGLTSFMCGMDNKSVQ